MKSNTLRNLIILAIALSGLAWFAAQRDLTTHSVISDSLFAPALEARLPDVTRVEIEAAGEERFQLEHVDGEWVVTSKAAYPADLGALRKLLRTLATTEVIEAKTAKPELHERLKLNAVGDAKDTTVEVAIFAGDEPVFGALLGKTGQGGQYVRQSNSNQTWLIADSLQPGRKAADWLHKPLLDLKRSDLRRATIHPLDGEPWSLERLGDDTTDFVLKPSAPDSRERNGANSNRLLSSLSNLRMLDVRMADADDANASWQELTFERFDGLQVQVKVREDANRYWLQLSASVIDASALPRAEDAAAPADQSAAQQLAATIKQRADGRVFEVSSYPGFGLAMAYEHMLKEEPASQP